MIKKLICYILFFLCLIFAISALSGCGGGDWEEDPLSLKCGDPRFVGPCQPGPNVPTPSIPSSASAK